METRRIDGENVGQKSLLSDLPIQRNSLYFIGRLPNEMLGTIFVRCARDHHRDNCGRASTTVPSWVNVSYVCRHWRDVAMNCPTLWTYLFITSPRWTEELLVRSKLAPLKLRVNIEYLGKSPGLYFLKQVMDHIERVQEVCLYFPPLFGFHTSLDSIFSIISSPAIHLQNLMISAPYIPLGWKPPSIMPFGGDTPALCTLDLVSSQPVPWYLFRLAGLTALSLRRNPTRYQQHMAEFLAKLASARALVFLYLEDALPSATGFLSSPEFHAFQKIMLPRLSRLLVAAPVSAVVALLSCIDVPSKMELRLQCHYEYDFPSYSLLSWLLAERLVSRNQTVSCPMIHSLVIKSNWDSATFAFCTSERDYPVSTLDAEWDCNIPFQITIHFAAPLSRYDRNRIIGDICGSIPLPNIQRLHVITPPFASAFWRKTLGQLQGLRYLKLSYGYMPDLASVLALTPHDSMKAEGGYVDRDSRRMFVPALETMELQDITFSTPQESGMPPAADVQPLYDALSNRKESQGRLTMTGCDAVMDRLVEWNMVGKWEDGHFHIVEGSSRPYESDGSDTDSLFTALEG